MAATKKKSVEVIFDEISQKKSVVRFDCHGWTAAGKRAPAGTAIGTVYVSNESIAELGDPKKIKITIEPA